jgi:6,7-dimethyl-8-ribityllumazine synthase
VQASSAGTAGTSAGDLLGSSTTDLAVSSSFPGAGPFDALIAIGVLIKGETMHFEYIAESVSSGLMRVSLDLGTPVIFGVLTVLDDTQARARAGLSSGSHNHGEDWGLAAVEMGVKRRKWTAGVLQ